MAKKTKTKSGGRAQDFSFNAPEALSVQLVGEFTQWQERPIDLQKDADGIWRATVELATGRAPLPFSRGRTMPG